MKIVSHDEVKRVEILSQDEEKPVEILRCKINLFSALKSSLET